MADIEKVVKGVHDARRYLEDREWVDKSVGVHIDVLNDALALLKELQNQIWEMQDRTEYLEDKLKDQQEQIDRLLEESASNAEMAEGLKELLKEQETKLICNLLGGQPYEVYCRECRTVLCTLGKGETMNDAKSIFNYCPHCGRSVKWE